MPHPEQYPHPVNGDEAIDELSELFLFLAENDFSGYSPVYESLARSVAIDRQLLRFVESSAHPNARRGRVPVLFFAATHDRVLANPESDIAAIYRGDLTEDPMPAFLALIDAERDAIVANMRTRSVQTNEVDQRQFSSTTDHAQTGGDGAGRVGPERGPQSPRRPVAHRLHA